MTAATAQRITAPEARDTLAQKMHTGYLEGALHTLELLQAVERETQILDSRGAVKAHAQSYARQEELRGWLERFEALAKLLEDGELL